MAFKAGAIFLTLLVGSLAVPVPDDVSYFYPENHNTRIVGGSAAPIGSHPWMVALTHGTWFRSFLCGGSIVSRNTILTAAHCIVPISSGNNLVTSARATIGTNAWNSGGQLLTLSGFSNHPQYNSNTIKNDIGVLYTTTPINYGGNINFIPLAYDNVGGGIQARVAGWGAVRASGPAQASLLQIDVTTLAGQQCVNDVITASANLNVRAPHVDPAIEICTFRAVNIGTCQGDSGSALVRTDRGQQIGVVSWGFPCARGAPDMFARVSGFQAWLNQNIRN